MSEAFRHKQIFLSAVTSEFLSYRRLLASDLQRPNLTVKVQDDFVGGGGTTLQKLDNYIRHCHAVVHLLGEATGVIAPAVDTRAICDLYPNLTDRLPQLTEELSKDEPQLSYTQWEAYLALYHGRPLYIFRATATAPRDAEFRPVEAERLLQETHYQRIEALGRDRSLFENQERLSSGVLRYLHDILPPAAPAEDLRVPIPGRADATYKFLTGEDFRLVDDNKAKPLAIGYRPSLTLLRDRQYMLRPDYLQSACERLNALLENRARDEYHDLNVFWIGGRSGSGKSVLLLQVMEEMVRAGKCVVWLDDRAEAFVPLIETLHPERGENAHRIPDLIFIDDMYAPRGQQEIDIESLRRLIGSAPEQRWPVVATCGPPEFEKQLDREAAGDGIQIDSWRLPAIKSDEATALRVWFAERTGGDMKTAGAFAQDEGLMVSMVFELRHGRLEPFARRFRDRLVAGKLDQCLRVPLALNRLYISTPESWLSREEWERLEELNADADFSVLESEQGSRYLRLTHPHVSDFVYKAVRVPGNPRAYANDVADGLLRALKTDLFTLRELLRVIAGGNERLELLDLECLVEVLGREWRKADRQLLVDDPPTQAEVLTLLASWSGHRPDLRMDERFGASLLEDARRAVPQAGDGRPNLLILLQTAYPREVPLLRDILSWLELPESTHSRVWHLLCRRLLGDTSRLSEDEVMRAIARITEWLKRTPEGDGWGGVFELVTTTADLQGKYNHADLTELGLQWLSRLNRNLWYSVWNLLISDPRLSPTQKKYLHDIGFTQLRAGRCRFNEWGWIWAKLLNEVELPKASRDELLTRGCRWVNGADDSSRSYVWERLLDEPELPEEIDRRELLGWGGRLLEKDRERRDWTFIWERLYLRSRLNDEERQALLSLGEQWLEGREHRDDWAIMWEHLLDADLPFSQIDRAQLLDIGKRWLTGREESKGWPFVWQNLIRAGLAEEEQEDLFRVGRQWLDGREESKSWPHMWQNFIRAGLSDEEQKALLRISRRWLDGRYAGSAPYDIESVVRRGASWVWNNRKHESALVTASMVVTQTVDPSTHDAIADWLADCLATNETRAEGSFRILSPYFRDRSRPEKLPGYAKLYDFLSAVRSILNHVQALKDNSQFVRGRISKSNEAGFIVELEGIRLLAFLPASHVDLHKPRDRSRFLGMEGDFEVTKVDHDNVNIVVSRRNVLAKALSEAAAHKIESLKAGDIVRGTVGVIVEYGAFVRLGGFDGLLQIADMSWTRPGHPSELVVIGQELEVMILDIDRESKKVTVGLKQLQPSPWEGMGSEYDPGTRHQVTVARVLHNGAIVCFENGANGFLYIGDLRWGRRIDHPSEVLAEGQPLVVQVLEIDREHNKISVGLKQLQPSPWDALGNEYDPGTRHRGSVINLLQNGALVRLDNGIDGFLGAHELSWSRRIEHASEVLEVGQDLDVQVVAIDPGKRELRLSLKRLEEGRWPEIVQKYPIGTIVECKVINTVAYGAFVELEPGVSGLLHVSEISWTRRILHPGKVFEPGQAIKCVVVNIDPNAYRILLSVKQMQADPWNVSIPDKYRPGMVVKGKISNIRLFGVFVELEPGLDGLLHRSKIAAQTPADLSELLHVGQWLQVLILEVNSEERRIALALSGFLADGNENLAGVTS